MKRRGSKLSVLIRLAKLAEDRTLQDLGRARQNTDRIENELTVLTELRESARPSAVLLTGAKLEAAQIAGEGERAAALGLRGEALEHDHIGANEVEERARSAVVESKRKIRALRRADSRRRDRERQLQRRVEMRRMDEMEQIRQSAGAGR